MKQSPSAEANNSASNKNIHAVYVTRRYKNVEGYQPPLFSGARFIQLTLFHPLYVRFILIVSSLLSLALPSVSSCFGRH